MIYATMSSCPHKKAQVKTDIHSGPVTPCCNYLFNGSVICWDNRSSMHCNAVKRTGRSEKTKQQEEGQEVVYGQLLWWLQQEGDPLGLPWIHHRQHAAHCTLTRCTHSVPALVLLLLLLGPSETASVAERLGPCWTFSPFGRVESSCPSRVD